MPLNLYVGQQETSALCWHDPEQTMRQFLSCFSFSHFNRKWREETYLMERRNGRCQCSCHRLYHFRRRQIGSGETGGRRLAVETSSVGVVKLICKWRKKKHHVFIV